MRKLREELCHLLCEESEEGIVTFIPVPRLLHSDPLGEEEGAGHLLSIYTSYWNPNIPLRYMDVLSEKISLRKTSSLGLSKNLLL